MTRVVPYQRDSHLIESLPGFAAIPTAPRPRGSRISRSRAVVAVTVASRSTLIDLDEGRRVTLQPFASRVWAILDARPTLSMLLEQLRDEGGRPEQVAEEATRLLSHWRQRGLIEWR